MIDLIFSDCNFSVFDGPQVPAICKNCGFHFSTHVPFYPDERARVILSRNVTTCPKCKSKADILDGFYEFFGKTVETLKDAKLTRHQVRRFERKLSKAKSLDRLGESVKRINPLLGDAVELAQQQPDPRSALQTVKEITTILLAIGSGLFVAGEGVITADDVWDRWQSRELFERKLPDTKEKSNDGLYRAPNQTPSTRQKRSSWDDRGSIDL